MPVVRISEALFKEVQKYAEPLVDNFETALWKALRVNHLQIEEPKHATKAIKTRSRAIGELTPNSEFWKPILNILIEKGGSASRPDVHELLKKRLQDKLKPGDKELNNDGTVKWEKQVDFQRFAMTKQGLLREESPWGTWEITEIGRQWVNNH